MSVNLHISVTVRGFDTNRAEAVKHAIQQIIEEEELEEDLPPLVERSDGKTRVLSTQSDPSLPVIISASYSWIPKIEKALSMAAWHANGGPCEVIFKADDADDGADDDLNEDSETLYARALKVPPAHICAVCGRCFANEFCNTRRGGDLLKFADFDTSSRSPFVWGSAGAAWICDSHVPAARERLKLPLETAVREIRDALGVKPVPSTNRKVQPELVLTDVGPNRAKVFSIIRQTTGLSPALVRNLLDELPAIIAADWPANIERLRRGLNEAGAAYEIQWD